MENIELFPFERNRYYMGKMLTSMDFQAEQLYMNQKRWFMNHMMFGNGIVCGLSVFNLDDLSVLVESGVAIDGMGREIVVDSSVVKKISAIEGFQELQGNQASLCVRYKEEEIHPIYAVGKQEQGNEYEYNRIQERYELFLMDTGRVRNVYEIESEFVSKAVLFEDEDFCVEFQMPSIVPNGMAVKLSVVLQKRSAAERKLELEGILQLPVFVSEKGEQELLIKLLPVSLKMGESFTSDYWLYTGNNQLGETSLPIKPGTVRIRSGNEIKQANEDFAVKTVIEEIGAEDLVTREINKISLEMRNMGVSHDFVCLADFEMVRTESAYLIDKISESTAKKYLISPAEASKRISYLAYFKSKEVNLKAEAVPLPEESRYLRQERPSREKFIAMGKVEIPLDVDMKKGAVVFSEEIMHGLGKGNVYVEVGLECLEEDIRTGANLKNTIYGETALFQEQNPYTTWIKTAVKVFQEKGSFQVAVQLAGEQKTVFLTLNWTAFKASGCECDNYEEPGDFEEEKRKAGILPETPVIRLGVKESCYVNVHFRGMDPCRLVYELTEEGSGEIASDGIYTAPNKPGVYEICIRCEEYPQIFTYAYAVVYKRGASDE